MVLFDKINDMDTNNNNPKRTHAANEFEVRQFDEKGNSQLKKWNWLKETMKWSFRCVIEVTSWIMMILAHILIYP